MADPDALDGRHLKQQQPGGAREVVALVHADHHNASLNGDGFQQSGQMRAAGDLQDVIDAVVTGEVVDGFASSRPIEHVVSAERSRPLPFLGVARGYEHFRPMRLGDLKPEQGDAARPLHQYA